MRMELPILACGGFERMAAQDNTDLVRRLDATPYRAGRRSDRLTLLALLGLADCLADREADPRTHLVLGSSEGNLASTLSMHRDIFRDGLLPRPIDFINSVNNSTCFHLGQAIGIGGETLSVSRGTATLEAVFQLAALQLAEQPGPVLAGTVDETPPDLDDHRRRMGLAGDAPLGEGSHWFLAGPGHPGTIGRIRYAGTARSEERLVSLVAEFGVTDFSASDGLPEPLRERLAGEARERAIAPGAFYSTRNGRWLGEWLRGAGEEGCYALVGRRPDGELGLIVADGPG